MLPSTGSRKQQFGLRDLTLHSFSQGLPRSSTKTYSCLPSDFHFFLPIIPQYPRKGYGSPPGRRALRSSISIQPGAPTRPNTVLGRAAPGPKPSLAWHKPALSPPRILTHQCPKIASMLPKQLFPKKLPRGAGLSTCLSVCSCKAPCAIHTDQGETPCRKESQDCFRCQCLQLLCWFWGNKCA